MRAQHYRFAHQVLTGEALDVRAALWQRLRTDPAGTLQGLWARAGEGLPEADRLEAPALEAIPLPMNAGREALLVSLPPPQAATECHHVALVREGGSRLRYFCMEKGLDGPDGSERTCWSEWRRAPDGSLLRVRGADLASASASAFLQALEPELERPQEAAPAPPAQASPAAPRRFLLALAILFALFAAGGAAFYLEEVRPRHVPRTPVAVVPVVPGQPFVVELSWSGVGYAFTDVWLVVEDAEPGPEDLRLSGTLDCGRPQPTAFDLVPTSRGIHRLERGPHRVAFWAHLDDEYLRRGAAPVRCTGSLSVVSGRLLRARIAVTQVQRPSDFFAF